MMASKASSVDEATNEDTDSLSATASSTTISTPTHSSSGSTSKEEESRDSRDRDVSSPISKHHHVLPEGWKCEYDFRSKEYRFYRESKSPDMASAATLTTTVKDGDNNDKRSASIQTSRHPSDQFQCPYGYHFPSSPTPSMITALAKEVASKTAIKTIKTQSKAPSGTSSSELELMQRMCQMFPTAPEALVITMTRTYHQRENLIIASLISQGFRRATDKNLPTAGSIDPAALIVTRPASKKLLDKLIGYFPDRDESYIKNLMVKHNEVEHEIISAIVESSSMNYTNSSRSTTTRERLVISDYDEDKDGAMMKLRYLKSLYPDCDEMDIFHMLHSNDMNAQSVIEKIEARGFKKTDIEAIMKKRKLLNQQMKAQQAARSAAAATKEKAILKPLDLNKKPPKPNVTKERLNAMKEILKKEFPNIYEELIDFALEAGNFSEGVARRCLRDMTPEDDLKYRTRFVIDYGGAPDEAIYPSRSTQTQVNYKNVVQGSPVRIAKNVAGNEWTIALTKISVGTWTGDDHIEDSCERTLASGHNPRNVCGSNFSKIFNIRSKLNLAKGKMDVNVQGRKQSNCLPKKLMSAQIDFKKSIAAGPDPSRRSGPDCRTLKKVHPFFA